MNASSNYARRTFLKGVAAGSAAAAVSACGVAHAAEADWMPEWDEETDVVVIGFGGSGGCAAIAAADAGAEVVVLEKSQEPEGGNTGCSTGYIHTAPFSDPDEWIEKITHGVYGTTPVETIEAMVDHAQGIADWLEEVGIEINWTEADTVTPSPRMPSYYKTGLVKGREGADGRYLWQAIYEAAMSRNVDVRLGTPAKHLVQNPVTKEILGVRAQGADGNEICIKARKGVVMAMGGYEGNPWKQGQYNQPGVRLYPWGTPNNTGDGIDMACEVGANLWHLHGLEWSSVNFRLASEEAGCAVSTNASAGIQPYNHVFVNQFGKRFMNESKNMNHDIETKAALNFDSSANEYANLPFYMVFDSTMFEAGPLYTGTGRTGIVNTYAGVHKLCDWGDDNEAALERGWIFKGDTIEELAEAMQGTTPSGDVVGCDAEALAATIEAYNGYVAAGEDQDFGRSAEKMGALDNPPYYAIEMGFSCINTQGGAQRNGNCQVISTTGDVLPRLYSAGEFGSINGFVYVFGNIYESLVSGRVAGSEVAKLDSWQ